jgi:hypothetical protein
MDESYQRAAGPAVERIVGKGEDLFRIVGENGRFGNRQSVVKPA